MILRLMIAAVALLSGTSANADPIDPAAYPELAPDVLLPPIIAELKRTLKDPYSIRDLVLCRPEKVKIKDGRPVRWSVLFSLSAKNSYGGYAGVKMYSAVFRDGRIAGGLSSAEFENDTGLSGLINSMVARKMATCPTVPDEKVQQLLSPGSSTLRQ